MGFTPTAEQQAAIDAFRVRGDMVLEAGAGTGKTSTLKLLARSLPMKRGIYLAYNKAIAKEAEHSFPESVTTMTAHKLAFQWLAKQWGYSTLSGRINAPRVPAYQTAKALGANKPLIIGSGVDVKVIQPNQQTRLAMETVKRFCWSEDKQITAQHVPPVTGVENVMDRAHLVSEILPMAHKAWLDVSRPNGNLRFEQDVYVKLYGLSEPHLDYDYLLFDEAQDANRVIAGIVANQDHLVTVAVGDSCQAIYGWRGATDFLSTMEARHHLYLSQSFRFGQPVADEANKWLGLLDATLRLKGAPEHVCTSTVSTVDYPDAVLCRSNAETIKQLMGYHEKGQPVALVGGGTEMKSLAEAAAELKAKGSTWHRELCAFTSWGQVQDYVEQDAAGGDLKVAVDLIDEYGPEGIIDAIDRTVPARKGVVTVSTAHKAKGLEWPKVKIASDFREPVPDEAGEVSLPPREEMMLAYVAVTRAQRVLDRTGLAWVDNYIDGGIRKHRTRAGLRERLLDPRAEFQRARRERNPGTLTAHEFAQMEG